jgi:hypothetical protein
LNTKDGLAVPFTTPDAQKADVHFKVSAKDTGEKKQIAGFDTHQMILTMEMEGTDKESGQKRSKLRVVCEHMQMLGARGDGGGAAVDDDVLGDGGTIVRCVGRPDGDPVRPVGNDPTLVVPAVPREPGAPAGCATGPNRAAADCAFRFVAI